MTRYDNLTELLLTLGDSAMVQAQRLCELVGKAPALEEEVALMNVGLDLVGQARNWLEYAAERIDDGRNADDLVFRRDERAYRNLLIVEQPNGDFAMVMAKQFLFDAWHYQVLAHLANHAEAQIAAIAKKSIKEVEYHLRRSSEWVRRLGDGTDESHQRMQTAIDKIWRFSFELADSAEVLTNEIPEGDSICSSWHTTVANVLNESTLSEPAPASAIYLSGHTGMHSEHLGLLLAEMQFLPRAYPDANW
ncbi:1,2-phenylacetyl-CoA epoxidase subunit PaaC [Marinobacterium sp. LSUCC0821]|jgi:ring-1,2-phenylacetyl-CoA epoxidase subunit PaaC|uniref:1,2-phenylacetyl-CoA epoxidase subunit PaaC n=1 Tax=Marinobacterium sp. LSUCC0821 TaxID=2668067 RepID=UPI0014529E37|nr:1,2-phenylacetyl-CoA epoxidase subunit PaaC [Marinobacterium sp. LSUCC0821]QJD71419.1 phenylacetate-CoA oxygenase subunit PaaC [Marinobacterium sp. LSUCC0821]